MNLWRLLLSCLVFFIGFSHQVNADFQQGFDWLSNQQQATGEFSTPDEIASSIQATHESILAFDLADQSGSYDQSAAEQHLVDSFYPSAELASRLLQVGIGADSSGNSIEQSLLTLANGDGGFGLFESSQSSALETAYALRAFQLIPVDESVLSQSISSVLLSQNPDGGWGINNSSSVFITSLVLRGISGFIDEYPHIGSSLNAGRSFLYSQRNANELWNSGFESALAVLALLNIVPNVLELETTMVALEDSQESDGSWAADTYTTALTLQALTVYQERLNDPSLTLGSIQGQVVVAGSGAPVPDATIEVLGLPGFSVTTNSNGQFFLDSLQPGPLTLLVEKPGFLGASRAAEIVAGQVFDTGPIQLVVDPSLAMLSGRIFDDVTHTNIGGASVTLTGPVSTTSNTSAGGGFEFTVLMAGAYTYEISFTGYHPVQGQVTLSEGQHIQVVQGLVPEGTPLDSDPRTLSVQILDAASLQPVSNAIFELDETSIHLSNPDGLVSVADVVVGTHSAQVSANGYVSTTLGFNIEPGSSGDLGAIYLARVIDGEPPTSITLAATVIDYITNDPIPDADVFVLGTTITGTSDANGLVVLNDIAELDFQVQVSAGGYGTQSFTIEVSGFGTVALTLPLVPSGDPGATESNFSGVITDLDSGLAIEGALVEISAQNISQTTDPQGSYVLSSISSLQFAIEISASGYLPELIPIDLAAHGDFTLNAELTPVGGTIFSVNSVVTPITPLLPGDQLMANTAIENLTSDQLDAQILVEIVDASGTVIGTTSPYAPGTQIPVTTLGFDGFEEVSLEVPWLTSQQKPGIYVLRISVIEPGSITRSSPRGTVFAVGSATFEIGAIGAIGGAVLTNPPISQAGTQAPIQLDASVRNVGNIAIPAGSYELTISNTNSGQVVYSTQSDAAELEINEFSIVNFGDWIPTEAGQFVLAVQFLPEPSYGTLEGSLLVGDVATANYSVSPSSVPEGNQQTHATIDLTGVDVTTGSSTDPLFELVRDAITRGGAYTGSNATAWHQTNRCLGCHIQTQSLEGLAASIDKADINIDDTLYLLNAVTTSQQTSGGLHFSHPQHAKNQTALGLWGLKEWPNQEDVLLTELRALEYLNSRVINASSSVKYWTTDHNTGWLNTTNAITGLIAQSAAEVIRQVESGNLSPTLMNMEVAQSWPLTTSTTVPRDLVYSDGWLYTGKTAGSIDRVDIATGVVERFISNLPNLTFIAGMAAGDDGSIYATGEGTHLHIIAPDGTYESVNLGAFDEYNDVAIDTNGDAYVVGRNQDVLLRVTAAGNVETVFSGSAIDQPFGVTRHPNGNFLVSSITNRRILEVSPEGNVSVLTGGFGTPPLRMAWSPDGELFIKTGRFNSSNQTTPHGINVLRENGTIERIGSNDGSQGIVFVDDRIFVGSWITNAVQEIELVEQSDTILTTFRNLLPGVAQFFLNSYTGNDSETIRIAFRLVGLAETREFVTNPAKLNEIDNAMAFIADRLRSRQRTDGGWGRFNSSNVSDPLTTAWIGIALDYTNPSPDDPIIRSTIEFLLNQQQSDGSWTNRGGYFSTRLAATSLVMTYLPQALERLGGIDIEVDLVNRPDESYDGFMPPPSSVVDNGDSTSTYTWNLSGVTSNGQQIEFDIDLTNMVLDEQRPASQEAILSFRNTFNDETVEVPIDIPTITAVSQVILDVTTDQPSYFANDDVDIQSLVTNERLLFEEGRLALRIKSLAGSTPDVAFDDVPLITLGQNESTIHGLIWNTGNFVAGNYEVVGEVYDVNDRLMAVDRAAFVIEASGQLIDANVLANQAIYEAWDQVDLSSTISNPSQNHIHDPTLAQLVVTDPFGVDLLNIQFPVNTLNIGDIVTRIDSFNLVDAPEGTYSVQLLVFDASGQIELVQDTTTFEVVRTVLQSLTGSVIATPQSVFQGDAVTCDDQVENVSSEAVSQVDVIRRLIQLDSQVVLDELTDTIDIPAGDTQSFQRQYNSDLLDLGGYSCGLFAAVDGEEQLLDFDQFVVLPPPIDIDVSTADGDRGRILILLDEPGYFVDEEQCVLLEQGQMTVFDRPFVFEDEEIIVGLFDDQGVLLETESFVFDDRAIDADDQSGDPNLWLEATRDGELSFFLTGATELQGTYQLVVDITANGASDTYDSGLITFNCDLAAEFQRTFGDIRITGLSAQPQVNTDEPFGPHDAATLNRQRAYLENVLDVAGWSYTIVTVAEEFVTEFRTGSYNLYGVFAEKEKLPTAFQGELKEAVFRGEGLLIAGLHDHRDSHFELPMGVNATGKHNDAISIDLINSPLTAAGSTSVELGEKVMKVELDGAESAAHFVLEGGPDSADFALAYHSYGEGKSVFGAWDVLVQAVRQGKGSLHESVITDAMIYPYNPATATQPGATVPIEIVLHNQGIAVNGQVAFTLPDDSQLLDSSISLTEAGGQWIWAFELDEDEIEALTIWVTLPTQSGDLDVLVQVDDDGVMEDFVSIQHPLDSTAMEVIDDVAADLTALYTADPDTYHIAQQAMGRAEDYLLDSEYEFAIRELLKVAGELDDIGGADADDLHLAISKLIRQVAMNVPTS